MHLNLYLGRVNTNEALYLFGVSFIALKWVILWNINKGKTWYKPHVWDVVNSFLSTVYLRNIHLLRSYYVPGRDPAIGDGVVGKI